MCETSITFTVSKFLEWYVILKLRNFPELAGLLVAVHRTTRAYIWRNNIESMVEPSTAAAAISPYIIRLPLVHDGTRLAQSKVLKQGKKNWSDKH